MSTSIPKAHGGVNYPETMWALSRSRGVRRYLEIGVNAGALMRGIVADTAVGVDPYFVISSNVTENKKRTFLLQQTSDHFFSDPDSLALLGGAPDLIFLDGMHTFEFLLRDFYNSEKIAGPSTLIVMHDCLPVHPGMAERSQELAFERTKGTAYEGWWTGDVWKVIPILQRYRPDLKILCVDSPPTGLVFVTNLDPSSSVLSQKYLDIVSEMRTVPSDLNELDGLYRSTPLSSSVEILNAHDHSLYFRC